MEIPTILRMMTGLICQIAGNTKMMKRRKVTVIAFLGIDEGLQSGNFVLGEGVSAGECRDKGRQGAGKGIAHDLLGLSCREFFFGHDDLDGAAVVDE